MSYWYDNPEGGRIRLLLVGAVAGALVVGIAWLGQWLFTRNDEPSPSVIGTPQSSPQSSPQSTDEAAADTWATSYLDRCQEVYDAQGAPLQAASDSMTQWEVHIGAMNKLVVGAITLKQATQFWGQTRVGASRNLDEFAAADRRFDRRTARCPEPRGSAQVTAELRTCQEAVAARNRTLELARVALDTWRIHVHHMNMLDRGEMTPEEATRLWLQNWRQGDRQVRDYRAAAQAAQDQTC